MWNETKRSWSASVRLLFDTSDYGNRALRVYNALRQFTDGGAPDMKSAKKKSRKGIQLLEEAVLSVLLAAHEDGVCLKAKDISLTAGI